MAFGGPVGAGTVQQGTVVHFIDVGQGDCALILSGDDAVLIDAGLTATADQVTEYLCAAGVSHLTAAVATHPHEDHIGGMSAVLDAFQTDTLYLPAKTAITPSYEAMLDAAERTGTAMQVPAPGQRLSLDAHASLAFLAPDPDAVFESVNDYSIISLLSADGLRVLFTGDAEAAAEQALLDSGADIACDVLKVGHHGSDTSSTDAFLDAAAPKIAVISCGKYNEYGHPHPETLARLQAHGAAIHVTADTGTFLYPTPDT